MPSRGVKVRNIEILKGCKIPLFGTLNLCRKMQDLIEKVWAQSDDEHFGNLWSLIKKANFQWFGAFFSAHTDPSELKPF